MPTPDIDPARIASHPAAAGVAGALLGLKWAPGTSLADKLINVIGGTALAGWGGPALAELWRLTPAQISLAGLVLGLFGISLADAVMRAIKAIDLARIAESWTTRR